MSLCSKYLLRLGWLVCLGFWILPGWGETDRSSFEGIFQKKSELTDRGSNLKEKSEKSKDLMAEHQRNQRDDERQATQREGVSEEGDSKKNKKSQNALKIFTDATYDNFEEREDSVAFDRSYLEGGWR